MHFAEALYLLVIGFLSVHFGISIRVDWNTNKGPIVPPTPRTTQRPQLPYREPAPVWEDQSDDIPNPNPYVYVLPPPSRPRPATNNYLTADRRPVTQENYYLYNNQNNYGSLIPPVQGAADYYQKTNGVAGLSPKYIPNIGFKYYAIVPNNNANNNGKSITSSANGLSNGYYIGSDKLQGKYNAKTKKYKAYEKVKYVPPNYYPYNEFALPETTSYRPIFDQYNQLLITQQQLPAETISIPFHHKNTNENIVQETLKIHNDVQPTTTSEIPLRPINPEAFVSKVAHSKDTSYIDVNPLKSNVTKIKKNYEKSSFAISLPVSPNEIKYRNHEDTTQNDGNNTKHFTSRVPKPQT